MEVTEFVKRFPTRAFAKGETLFGEGVTIAHLYMPIHGYVKITSIDDMGVERLLWIVAPGDIIPFEHLLTPGGDTEYFYTALTSMQAYAVKKQDFLQYITTTPDAMAVFAATASEQVDELMQRIDGTSQQSVRGKLIATLHHLASRFATNSSLDLHHIGLPLTHLDFAEMIGATRETTSIELQHLRKQGYVTYSRSSFVIHKDRFDELFL